MAPRRSNPNRDWPGGPFTISPVADELGVPLGIPAANAAEHQIARVEEGWGLEEIYAEQVKAGEVVRG